MAEYDFLEGEFRKLIHTDGAAVTQTIALADMNDAIVARFGISPPPYLTFSGIHPARYMEWRELPI